MIISSHCLAAFVFLVLLLSMASPVFALGQIYSWTDSDGIRHFTNKPPAEMDTDGLAMHDEIPFDAVADEKRDIEDHQWMQQQETADLEERLGKAEQKAATSQQQAEESARKAAQLQAELEAARKEKEDSSRRVYIPYQPYPSHRHHLRPAIHRHGTLDTRPRLPGWKPSRPHTAHLPWRKHPGASYRIHVDRH